MSDPSVTIDLNDLNGSDLKQLLVTGGPAMLAFNSEIKQHFGAPVRNMAELPGIQFTISKPGAWKTSTGVGFTLKASAGCKCGVAQKSTAFKLAKAIDSDDTQAITGQAPASSVFINIEMDFDIQGNLSGSGTVGGIGIGGKASGKGAATFTYCHPVDGGIETREAIVAAFTRLKLPFQPNSVTTMPVGAIGNVKFDGSFNLELDLSYGLGSYKLCAPGVAAARTSLSTAAAHFTPPSLEFDAGIKAAFTYTHAESYEAIVRRDTEASASLFLSRSSSDDTQESIGLKAGVSLSSAPSASLDVAKLGAAINRVTKAGGDQAASAANQLQSSLLAKASSWLSSEADKYGNVTLKAALEQQKARALLYEFGPIS